MILQRGRKAMNLRPEEWNNEHLQEYRKKHLHFDRIKNGLRYLSDIDVDDLNQELNLKCFEITILGKNKNYSYYRKAYKHVVIDFARDHKRNDKMQYMTAEKLMELAETFTYDDPDDLCYWDYECLEGLNDFEQAVLFLKYVKHCQNREIIRLLKYDGTENNIRQICWTAKQKLQERQKYLEKKRGF